MRTATLKNIDILLDRLEIVYEVNGLSGKALSLFDHILQ